MIPIVQLQRSAGEKVRNPAAMQSLPSRWYFMVSSGHGYERCAVDRPECFAQRRAGDEGAGDAEGPPMARPIAATVAEVGRTDNSPNRGEDTPRWWVLLKGRIGMGSGEFEATGDAL
ncbi:hypothetical protein HB777_29965 [Mesorhizobium loti]|nr:hypothetical protein HB777_29965 [Mesorhizobium loti]